MEEKFKITFSGMDSTNPLRDYALEKFTKHAHLLDNVVSVDIILTQNIKRKGVSKDFELSVTASVPRTRIHIDDRGQDMYALIDTTSDKFFRLLNRYNEKLSQWKGESPWKTVDNSGEQEVEDSLQNDYSDYEPVIAKRRKMEDLSPMDEAEAIENMELQNWDQYMFKNRKTGKISVVYRLGDNYGIIEEPDKPV